MIPGGTPNPPLRRVVDAPFTSKSHFGLLAVRCLSYMGWGSPLFFFFTELAYQIVTILGYEKGVSEYLGPPSVFKVCLQSSWSGQEKN